MAIQSMFLRPPMPRCHAIRSLSEMEYQFSNWYHFRWLSGDDVTQSLVHNLDRMRLGAPRRKPHDVLRVGRPIDFIWRGLRGHVRPHSVVYEFASGPRIYALCQTRAGCYHSLGRYHHGLQRHLLLDRLPH